MGVLNEMKEEEVSGEDVKGWWSIQVTVIRR
jgi:hypothetical protein